MIRKKIILSLGVAVLMSAISVGMAFAATSNVTFDSGAGKLIVSGNCSANFVLVVVRKSSDGSIWGSSNPACVNGTYQYDATIPEGDRQGGVFIVDVADSMSAAQAPPAKNDGAAGGKSITFAPPAATIAPSASDAPIVLDTSSVATAPDDQSFLDGVLSKFFGIIADASDAAQSFGAIFANSIKASLVAAVNLFSKTITILPGGSITIPRGANQMAGADSLGAGATDVFIPNTSVVSSSAVMVTPTSPTDVPLIVREKQDGVGFRVGIAHPASAAISFDWLIMQTYSASPPAVSEQSVPVGGSPGGGGVDPPADNPVPEPAPPSTDVPTSTDALPPDPTSTSVDMLSPNDSSSSIDSSEIAIPADDNSSTADSAATTTTTSDASNTADVSP